MSKNQIHFWTRNSKSVKCSTPHYNLKTQKLQFQIDRKPTSTHTHRFPQIPINFSTQNSQLSHSLIHILLNVSITETDFNNEVNIIKTTTINNKYSDAFIDKMIIKKRKDMLQWDRTTFSNSTLITKLSTIIHNNNENYKFKLQFKLDVK